MDTIFKKLNYKGQPQVFALNAPGSFEVNLQSITDEATIKTKVGKADKITFAIGFATKQTELDSIINQVAPKLEGDAILWLCYPKGTSKNTNVILTVIQVGPQQANTTLNLYGVWPSTKTGAPYGLEKLVLSKP